MPGPGPSIRPSRSIRAAAFVVLAAAFPAAAEDLLQIYRDAQRYDAVYTGARYSLDAGRERIPQARALLLPSVNLTANVTSQHIDVTSSNTAVTPSFSRNPSSNAYNLTLSQPL